MHIALATIANHGAVEIARLIGFDIDTERTEDL